jgi:hypothetical protein
MVRPADGVLRLCGLKNEVRSAYRLAEPARRLEVTRKDDVLAIAVGARGWDEFDTVVVLEISGTPRTDPQLITQGSDIPFQLDYRLAATTGRAVKRFNRDGGFHIAKWTAPEDAAEWRLLVSQPGTYRVLVSYAAPRESAGRRYTVRIGDRSVEGSVGETGEGYHYREFDLGLVELKKAGPLTVRLSPVGSGGNLMYFQRLTLRQLTGTAVE